MLLEQAKRECEELLEAATQCMVDALRDDLSYDWFDRRYSDYMQRAHSLSADTAQWLSINSTVNRGIIQQ